MDLFTIILPLYFNHADIQKQITPYNAAQEALQTDLSVCFRQICVLLQRFFDHRIQKDFGLFLSD